ncbi:MAG: T9SS type A sorting domain-containing protein [Cyclobacteriaceae bacterium]
MLDNYYAYDDGTAEYGASLNQPGALLAYLFNMNTLMRDTIVAIDFYFPEFGEDIGQSIEVQILRDLSGDPSSFLHKQTASVVRGTKNKFWRLGLERLVGVKDQFYVGWKQSTSTALPIGLDKNTNSGDKIFFNTNGEWEPSVNLVGSLMIRPVFGKGIGVFTGLPKEEVNPIQFYPNPSNGNFIITGNASTITVYDITGRIIAISVEEVQEGKRVQLLNAHPGLYILRVFNSNGVSSHRIKVD